MRRLVDAYESGVITRRSFIRSLLALGVSTGLAVELLAACGSTSSSSGSQGVSSSASPAGTPDLNATINMAYSEEDWTVNGTGVKSTTFAYQLNMNVYEPLIYLASDYTLKPGLAESWEFIQPGTWRFHLRKGVKFHDGSPFSADDVVWTWGARQQQGKTLGTVANTLGPNSVVKVDDYTVDFIPVTPNFRVPQQIVHPEGAIVPKGKNF
ncbi:MAG TPA: ABC transporter substrate-binding protein, partial [Candidatus Dormibacteraeota bacterium]|nr:ABC transporter substrate-binding protein [Candidatus Dormibacteraeota bacterium]